MWWILGFLFAYLIIIQVSKFLSSARQEITETIGEVVMATRMPSGTVTVQELERKNIHPYFCSEEYRMVWVEHPTTHETCPWCNGALIPFS